MKRLFWLFLFALLITVGVAALYWFGAPRLVSFTPNDAAFNVPAGASLQLTFSQFMQMESVAGHLRIEPAQLGSITWQDKTLIFTPGEPWPVGESIRIELAPGSRAAHWPSLAMRQGTSWTFTLTRPQLVYLYPASGPANLYMLDPINGEVSQLTNIPRGVLEYDANRDGKAIFFSVGNNLGGSDIYRLDLQEKKVIGEPKLVLDCQLVECRAPSISSKMDWLAFEIIDPSGSGKLNYQRVWYLPLKADEAVSNPLTIPIPNLINEAILAGETEHNTINPNWSPSGWLSFYDIDIEAFIFLNPNNGARMSYPNQTGEPGSWDPSGEAYIAPEITFDTSSNPTSAPGLTQFASSRLMLFNLLDGSTQDLTRSPDIEDTSPAFSPDGSFLAFARKFLDVKRWTPGRQLWIMRADGSQARGLTNNPNINYYDFDWDPSGSQLAVVRFDQTAMVEAPEIWLIDSLTSAASQWIVGGYAPLWIR